FSLEGLNRKSEAEGLYLRAQGIYIKRTGSQSLSVAAVQRSLGFLYCDQERYAEAFPLLKEAFDTRKSILPELSQEVGDGYADMGDYYDWKREPENAEANFRKALFIYTRLKGEDCKDAQVARTKMQRLAKQRLEQRVN
ncbi:MAG: tetratricopeptide repeat protein, partial [Cyanobacteria bacterium HKST-UBA01]|nr:tetratricopeptide repeat protein [Cyanobacteria bacterium HKST-UBA01]